MDQFPVTETGQLHLTPAGWVRQDRMPFPKERVETWSFEREVPSEDAKESVCLTRIWCRHGAEAERAALNARFGSPFQPTPCRNVLLECEV